MRNHLLEEIKSCKICEDDLPLGANPVLSFSKQSKILIIGQAPGVRVHNTGIPWNDQSGKNLRAWLRVSKEEFYDEQLFGIVPMGFCYPGTGNSGDLPPRKECALHWHQKIMDQFQEVELTLLIGMYAQKHYLPNPQKTLTQNIQQNERWGPKIIALPHPSPRNIRWMKKNPWFDSDILPYLQQRVHEVLSESK